MKVLRGDPAAWPADPPGTALAVGVFDGLHAGHRTVLSTLALRAEGAGLIPGVVTFDPHPLSVVAPERAPRLLTSVEHRLELLEGLGMGLVAVVPFDDAIRDMTPAEFVGDLLVAGLGMRLLGVGEDFRFGRDRTGHVELLEELGVALGFETQVVALLGRDHPLSSTSIREMVATGEVAAAAEALGRLHEVWGIVVEGDGRGKSIGVPTANLRIGDDVALPAGGVYAVTVGRDAGESLAGVANIGTRPTFDGDGGVTLEAHILDFEEDLYGLTLRVRFVAKLRDEQKFESVDELVAQIARDVAEAHQILQ
jgi:riboflavin kinase/FMN adenylyltransferase